MHHIDQQSMVRGSRQVKAGRGYGWHHKRDRARLSAIQRSRLRSSVLIASPGSLAQKISVILWTQSIALSILDSRKGNAAQYPGRSIMTVHFISESKLPEFEKALARISRAAFKAGLPAPVVEERGERFISTRKPGRIEKQFGFEVISNPVIQVPGGWRLAGVVRHEAGGNLIFSVSGDMPESARTGGPTCDHCGLTRKRSETFVLRNTAGETTRVGRQCLADFLNEASAESICLLFSLEEVVSSFAGEGETDGFGGGVEYFDPKWVAATSAAVIRVHGFVGKGTARENGSTSTAQRVDESHVVATTADEAVGLAALAWGASLSDAECIKSDFLHNVRVCCRGTSVSARNFGILVAAVNSFLNAEAAKLAAQRPAGSFIGTVGDRFGGSKKGSAPALIAKVTLIKAFEGQFGLTHLIKMVDNSGNELMTFFSGEMTAKVAVDSTLTVAATVKAHQADKISGRPVTVLTRCSFQ
jgi:hypothetical protein